MHNAHYDVGLLDELYSSTRYDAPTYYYDISATSFSLA